ncbi:hypothetical protein SCUP234_11305 [Seiridium cupressi]
MSPSSNGQIQGEYSCTSNNDAADNYTTSTGSTTSGNDGTGGDSGGTVGGTNNNTSNTDQSISPPAGLSIGAQAGIGVGVGVPALAAICGAIFWFCSKRNKNNNQVKEPSDIGSTNLPTGEKPELHGHSIGPVFVRQEMDGDGLHELHES